MGTSSEARKRFKRADPYRGDSPLTEEDPLLEETVHHPGKENLLKGEDTLFLNHVNKIIINKSP